MRRELWGSTVVVVGASSGIGRATALAFADHGAHVIAAARTAPALEELVAECRRRGSDARAVSVDIGDEADARRIVEAAVAAHGRIDTWVNSAAVLVAGVLGDEAPEEIERL